MLPLVRAIVKDLAELSRDVIDRRERLAHLLAGHNGQSTDVYSEELVQIEEELEKDGRRLRDYVEELIKLGLEPKNGQEGLVDFPDIDRWSRSVFVLEARRTGSAVLARTRRRFRGPTTPYRRRRCRFRRQQWRNAGPLDSSSTLRRRQILEVAMIKGSEVRKPDHPIDKLFLDRWSPRAMSGEEIPEAELKVLFEAARWAPSSYNNQPCRILYARRNSPHWPTFFDLMVEPNQAWTKNAAALLVFISKTTFDFNGKPYPTHSFDTGAAWENLALQAWLKGYVAHGMQGFDYDKAKTALKIPDGFRVEAMVAIGKPGRKEDLSEQNQKREAPSDRKELKAIVCEGPFSF